MSPPERCDRTRSWIRGFLDGTLDEPRRRQVRSHLRRCADCHEVLVGTTAQAVYEAQCALRGLDVAAAPAAAVDRPTPRTVAAPVALEPQATAGPLWTVVQAARTLAEPLCARFDDLGNIVVLNLLHLVLRPAVVGLEMSHAAGLTTGRRGGTWRIPVEAREGAFEIELGLRPAGQRGVSDLSLQIRGIDDPSRLARSEVVLRRHGEALPVAEALMADLAGQPLRVTAGEWELSVTVASDVQIIPIVVAAGPIP